MNTLQILLLGGFTVNLNEQPITNFRSAKSRALLAYLAIQPGHTHDRSTLAALLWGDLPETAAKTNLRVELSHLKKLLQAAPALEISRKTVRFNRELASVDVITFKEAVQACEQIASTVSQPSDLQIKRWGAMENALTLYHGEFLAGFHLADAVAFDDWRLVLQEQLHEQMMLALNLLQRRYAERGEWAALARTARRQLAIVPWLEAAHRHLIQALAAQGQRQAALTQYARCRAILQKELGVEPALAT